MKRIFTLAVVILIIVTMFILNAEAQNLSLVFNGQAIEDNLIKVVNGRTLISAQFISDNFEDDLSWNERSKILTIKKETAEIRLEINNRIAVVNGKAIALESKPRVIAGEVMLPLRFLTAVYGGKLEWESKNKKINYHLNRVNDVNVKTFQDSSQVILDLNFLSKYDLKLAHQPKRLVLDIYDTSLGDVKKLIPSNSTMIKGVRISQYKFNPATVRVVVELNNMSSYNIIEKKGQLIIDLNHNTKVVASSIISNYIYPNDKLKLSRKKIVIDAGHGGYDPGAIGARGVKEKWVNYQIATKVKDLLKSKGYNTIMTRASDQYISLAKRAELANGIDADIFISIHSNFNPRVTAQGTATYAHWNATKDNWALAWYVQSELIKKVSLQNNGLKAANFAVLRETQMPAILIETAFLSNPAEEKLLKTDIFQQKVAEGIVEGLEKYYLDKE